MHEVNETYTGNLAAVTILRRMGHEPDRFIVRGGRAIAVYPGRVHDTLEVILGDLALTRHMFSVAGSGEVQSKAGPR